MNRAWPLLILIAFLAPILGADDAGSRDQATERARRFARNAALIDRLVQSGLGLAATDDPLQRADCCHHLAEALAQEMHEAGSREDRQRVAELGQYLHVLLERGVAGNLIHARQTLSLGDPQQEKLRRIGESTTRLVRPLETELSHESDQPLLRHTLQALRAGEAEVSRALHE